MTTPRLQIGFFVVLIGAAFALTLWLFLPFLAPILLAGVLAIVFYPIHIRLYRKMENWPSIAAAISTVFILLVILAPLTFFGWLVVQESVSVYQDVVAEGSATSVVFTTIESIENAIEALLPIERFTFSDYISPEDTKQYVLGVLTWVRDHIGTVFSQVVEYSLAIFIMVIALFSFLRDGQRFVVRLIELSPLANGFDEQIVARVGVAVNSVIRGEVVIAMLQGILTGVGFWVFNIPNPAIWGLVAAIAAFIPTAGTTVVFIPGILYVLYTVGWLPAVGLFAWGAVLVGLLDNVLRPVLIDRGMNIHPFLILISVFGGLHVFGPIGFVAGPVILGFFFALVEIYPVLIVQLSQGQRQ